VTMSEIFKFQRHGIDEQGNVLGAFKATGLIPGFYERLRQRGITIDRQVFDPDRIE
jgi:pilus assembly protein CpaF